MDKLWTLVSEQTRLNYAKKPDGPAPIIDAVHAVSMSLRFQYGVNYPNQGSELCVIYLWAQQVFLYFFGAELDAVSSLVVHLLLLELSL